MTFLVPSDWVDFLWIVIPVRMFPFSPDFLFTLMLYIPTSLNWPSAMAIAGFICAMSLRKLMNLYSAYGITLFANTNAHALKARMKIVRLFIARCNEIPEDFIAANS